MKSAQIYCIHLSLIAWISMASISGAQKNSTTPPVTGKANQNVPLEEWLQDKPWLPERKPANEITDTERADMRRLAELFPLPEKPQPISALGYSTIANSSYEGIIPDTPAKALKAPINTDRLSDRYSPYYLSALIDAYGQAATASQQKALWKKLEDAIEISRTLKALRVGNAYSLSRSNIGENLLAISDELKEQELYDAFAIHYIWLLLGQELVAEKPLLNMDKINHRLPICWKLAAHLPDGPRKLHFARLLQRMMNRTLASKWPEEFNQNDLLTPDGGAIHHATHHMAYVSYSMPTMIELVGKLHTTTFCINQDAHERIRTFLRATAFSTVGTPPQIPGNVRARINVNPLSVSSLPNMMRTLAHMGSPDGTEPIDRAMAALYLSKVEAGEEADSFRELGITPDPLTGHWTLNIASLSLHRRADWLVTMNGASAGWRGSEIYAQPGTGNNYSRYGCNGSLYISDLQGAGEASGYRYDGWNWSFIPGATSLETPFYQLTSKRPGYIGNPSSFGGGIHQDDNGIWGMDFTGEDVHFKKSAFFFDERITVLTSEVDPKKDRTAVTTLFQLALPNRKQPIAVDTKLIDQFPWNTKLTPIKGMNLTDQKGNGYYLHPFKGKLICQRSEQEWFYLDRLKRNKTTRIEQLQELKRLTEEDAKKLSTYCTPSKGDFALAYVEHDDGDESACAFTVLPKAGPKETRLFYNLMQKEETAPYRILAQSASAHILQDRALKTTGYVLFEAHTQIEVSTPLLSNSRPCFVMLKDLSDGKLACSSGARNMNNTNPIILQIKGHWTLGGWEAPSIPTLQQDDHSTYITLDYHDYRTMHFTLEPSPPAGTVGR